MRFIIVGVVAIGLFAVDSGAQVQDQRSARYARYMEHAEVNHLTNSATVVANSPRPLAQALTALNEEFAWVIDYEDPPYYSKHDLVDDTAPEWRAAHPNGKTVTAIGGNSFQSQFPKSLDASSMAEEEHVLDTVVSDYNKSGNPGRFSLINEGDGRFAVIGTHVKDDNGQEQAIGSVLDTPITVTTDTRDAYETISMILDAVSIKTHTKIGPGMVANNALSQSQVTVGGQNVPARALLVQTLSATNLKLYWHLYYDKDVKLYMFNVLPLMKATYDASGKRTTDFVR